MDQINKWRIPGAIYHVMNRGNRKCPIFEEVRERRRFLGLLTEALAKFGVELLIGVQMVTHFHLAVCTPRGNLPDFMQDFEGQFARYSNWRHRRVGHLFQCPYRRVLVENDLHLFIVAAYIYNNPVVAKYVSYPQDWKWSTYAATIGLAPVPKYLSLSWVETLFPSSSLIAAQQLLRRCIDDPQQILAYIEAVDPTTEAAIRSYIAERRQLIDQPCTLRHLLKPPIEQLVRTDLGRRELVAAITSAHETHGYKLAEIARQLGWHRSTASKIYRSRVNHMRNES
jgi:putative transposase